MESKYYTPEIEEFHVGFEYGSLENIRDASGRTSWNSWIIKNAPTRLSGIHDIYFKGKENKLRVKHLDREDIEGFGFVVGSGSKDFEKGEYQLELFDSIVHISKSYGEVVLFHGAIKNKSELKKILKQIGCLS